MTNSNLEYKLENIRQIFRTNKKLLNQVLEIRNLKWKKQLKIKDDGIAEIKKGIFTKETDITAEIYAQENFLKTLNKKNKLLKKEINKIKDKLLCLIKRYRELTDVYDNDKSAISDASEKQKNYLHAKFQELVTMSAATEIENKRLSQEVEVLNSKLLEERKDWEALLQSKERGENLYKLRKQLELIDDEIAVLNRKLNQKERAYEDELRAKEKEIKELKIDLDKSIKETSDYLKLEEP